MGIKEKNALKPGRRDKVIMEEIEALITDFGFNINQFVEYACEMDVAIFSPNKGALDRSNTYQYFIDRPVPLHALWKLANHLRSFEVEIPPEDQRLEEYQDRAKRIQDEAFQYIIENKSNPRTLRPIIRDIFKPQAVLTLERFFEGISIFSFSERVWAFWLCYACLHRDAQEDILELMAEAHIAPKDHTRYLMKLHNWERDGILELCDLLHIAPGLFFDFLPLESQALGAGGGFFQRQFLTAVITVILYIHPRSLLLDRTIVPDDNG